MDVKGLGEWVNMIKIDYKTLKELIKLPKNDIFMLLFTFQCLQNFNNNELLIGRGERNQKCERTLVSFNLLKTGILLIISEDMN